MRTITFAFLATFVGTTLGGPLEDADTASKQGDYESALRLIRPQAEEGNAKAQKSLGDMYLDGHGVARDDVEAASGTAWRRTRATRRRSSSSAPCTTEVKAFRLVTVR
jgi:uncharacterized protein